jgi:Family of unknown function (DUF5694)
LKKEIILVGTFHFEQDAELIKRKENEIKELVNYLAGFKPTGIALEWEKTEDDELNKEYKNSNGNYSIDEIQQVGFRLAEKLKHEKVYAVNWTGHLTQDDINNLNNEIRNSYPDLLNTMMTLIEKAAVISSDSELINSFRELNDKRSVKDFEKMYLSFVDVKDGRGEMLGFTFLNKWMERELMICKNIVETSTSNSEERILLIIGSDHLWMLRRLFEGLGWDVVNPFS